MDGWVDGWRRGRALRVTRLALMGAYHHSSLTLSLRSLRENDHLGRNRTSYRITVRQLESLVRLSEVRKLVPHGVHV